MAEIQLQNKHDDFEKLFIDHDQMNKILYENICEDK